MEALTTIWAQIEAGALCVEEAHTEVASLAQRVLCKAGLHGDPVGEEVCTGQRGAENKCKMACGASGAQHRAGCIGARAPRSPSTVPGWLGQGPCEKAGLHRAEGSER